MTGLQKLVRVPISLPGILDYVALLLFSLAYFGRFRRSLGLDAYYSTPHVDLLTGAILKLVYGRRVWWICDIFDHPQRFSRNSHGLLLRMANRLFNGIIKGVLHWGDLFIVTGANPDVGFPKILRSVYRVPGDRLLCVTNGVSLDMFQPAGIGKASEEGFHIFFVGYVGPYTGIGTLLAAARKLKGRIQGLKVTLVGFSKPRDVIWLEKEVARLGLKHEVDFYGVLESQEIPPLIAASDVCVFVHPRREEYDPTYPIKIYEYLAMSKAVIASDMTGTRQLINHGENGLLFEAGNSNAMANAIYEIYSDPELRQRIEGNARHSVEAYDWGEIHEKIIKRLSRLENNVKPGKFAYEDFRNS